MTGPSVDAFWDWLEAGGHCELNDPDFSEIDSMRLGAQSTDALLLGALASHDNAWVRMAVAVNPHTPMWALWGDGKESFGLAGDPNMWIRARTIMKHPYPPSDVLAVFGQEDRKP